jgi:hypothetical protein
MDNLNSTEYLVVMIGWGISIIFLLIFVTIIYKKCGHIEGEENKKKIG